jgi:hypothetical protein
MKKEFINTLNIISATIVEPYESSKEYWDHTSSHGWKIVFVMNNTIDGFPYKIEKEYKSLEECEKVLSKMNLICL